MNNTMYGLTGIKVKRFTTHDDINEFLKAHEGNIIDIRPMLGVMIVHRF